MSEIVLGAITIKTTALGDNDCLIKFLTPQGVISAKARGVKKADAKLKFCTLPFCFSEITLAERGGFYTLIGATCYDTFFDLSSEYERYCAASAVLETAELYDSTTAGRAMIEFVNAFKAFLSGRVKESLVKYLLSALAIAGYKYEINRCAGCQREPTGKIYFDLNEGIRCAPCGAGAEPLTPAAASALRLIGEADYTLLEKYKLNNVALDELLILLRRAVQVKTDLQINSISQLVRA